MWQSRQSTRCCDGRWTWSTWRTSRQPPPSPPRRRNGTPHWSSPGWKWDFDQEVNEKQSGFGFWSTHRSFTITTKVPDETSLKEKPDLMKGQNMNPLWTQKCYFAWLLDTTIVHLVWKIEEGSLQNHHEDDPLIKRGLWGLVRTLTIRYYMMVICNIYKTKFILTEWYFVLDIWVVWYCRDIRYEEPPSHLGTFAPQCTWDGAGSWVRVKVIIIVMMICIKYVWHQNTW